MQPGQKFQHLDAKFLARVKRAYRLMLDDAEQVSGVWGTISDLRAPVHEALLATENDGLRAIFADPIRTDLFCGVDNISDSNLGRSLNDPEAVAHFSQEAKEHFLSLTRTLNCSDDPELALGEIDKLLNQRIEFPAPFRGEIGLKTSRGTVSFRAIQSIYQAWRLCTLLAETPNYAVLEIGPGMGRTAFYAYRSGLTDYTTLDLPLGVIAQACFLAAVLGSEAIWLLGDDAAFATNRIRLFSSKKYLSDRFSLVLQADGLTEMPPAIAIDYAFWIGRHADRFLSINHGKNPFLVSEVVSLTLACAPTDRRKYPVRDGYAEELFDFKSGSRRRFAWLAAALFFGKYIWRRMTNGLVLRLKAIGRWWKSEPTWPQREPATILGWLSKRIRAGR